MLELPNCAPFLGDITPRIVDARTEAPGGYGWPAASGTVDGGGWWQVDLEDMRAGEPHHFNMARAFASSVRGGRRVRVPVRAGGVTPGGRGPHVPFADGATFGDGARFVGGRAQAYLVNAVGLRDDEALIDLQSGQNLIGGELFSLERTPELGPELHLIDGLERVTGTLWRVRVGPQFRADHAAGAEVNFNDPAFAATVPDPSPLWPKKALGSRFFRIGCTLVEAE